MLKMKKEERGGLFILTLKGNFTDDDIPEFQKFFGEFYAVKGLKMVVDIGGLKVAGKKVWSAVAAEAKKIDIAKEGIIGQTWLPILLAKITDFFTGNKSRNFFNSVEEAEKWVRSS